MIVRLICRSISVPEIKYKLYNNLFINIKSKLIEAIDFYYSKILTFSLKTKIYIFKYKNLPDIATGVKIIEHFYFF